MVLEQLHSNWSMLDLEYYSRWFMLQGHSWSWSSCSRSIISGKNLTEALVHGYSLPRELEAISQILSSADDRLYPFQQCAVVAPEFFVGIDGVKCISEGTKIKKLCKKWHFFAIFFLIRAASGERAGGRASDVKNKTSNHICSDLSTILLDI